MKKKKSFFVKITIIIALLIIPIVILHSYSYQTSVSTMREEMMNNKKNQLSYLKEQMEHSLERLSLVPSSLSQDLSVALLQSSVLLEDPYLRVDSQRQLKEKMFLQIFSNPFDTEISVYFSDLNRVISTSTLINKNNLFLEGNYGEWEYYEVGKESYFRLLYTKFHSQKSNPEEENIIIEIRFDSKNIKELLMQNSTNDVGDLFVYTGSGDYIETPMKNKEINENIVEKILRTNYTDENYHQFEYNHSGENYQVSYLYLPVSNTYLIDYTPIEKVMMPILESRNLFIISLSALLILTIISLFLLYKNVQRPIMQLIKGLSGFELGNYSFRIKNKYNNEFDYLISSFNQMGAKIQYLIENIYEEQNRSRLASIKQLQSQINPHFLYNCLSFISSCTKVGATDSAIKMTYHLADYYRYTTDVENQNPTLQEEIELIENYLEIYKIRSERLEFDIDIPNDMRQKEFIRLTLQPIVENAVVHGLETHMGDGWVKVTGSMDDNFNKITIEDNGRGVSQDKLIRMQANLDAPFKEEVRVGLQNVHQRLKYHFGEGSGLTFSHSKYGGLCVEFRWKYRKN
ncbi:sensor histidine kinase [Gracilibacillus massiliensis]|uniref:sensor histidine kinase n=1 Tax=Gracilibacillus massiliensis TaxID=1564956 RepID=UPI00071DABF5|nr:histidine kinase [Gracilibacillus massiliensis]